MTSATLHLPAAAGEKISLAASSDAWPFVSGGAAKLYVAMCVRAATADIADILQTSTNAVRDTADALAAAAGLSDRTVSSALRELDALGWISYSARRGEGITWRLRDPQHHLTADGGAYYRARIERAQQRAIDAEARLLQAEERRQDSQSDEELAG
jgi:hypothetical protein